MSVRHDLILLDLDGTLMDSAAGIISSIRHTYATLGIAEPTADELRRFVGPPITQSFVAHGVPAERLPDAMRVYRADFAARGMHDNAVFPGVADVLAALVAAGATLAVATSKPEVYARELTAAFGLDPYLAGTYGASLDESTRASKAAVITYALLELEETVFAEGGLPTRGRTVMVGDRSHDVVGAQLNGIECIGVAWGYADDGELAAHGAVAVVETPAQLGALLLA